MLKFAAVGNQGTRLKIQGSTRIPRCDLSLELCALRTRIAACAILTAMWVAPVRPQASFEFDDLFPELAAKIAAIVAPETQVSLTASSQDSNGSAPRRLQEGIATLLASRGVRVVDAGNGIVPVGLSCSGNLRERSCLAEVQKGSRQDVVMVTRRHDGTTPVDSRPTVSLELRPLFAQRTPILDVVNLSAGPASAQGFGAAGLLVLDPTSVALYRQTAQGWQPAQSRPLPASRVWPRDVRGRLRVDGERFGVFLPGVTCSGNLNELTLDCADGRQPWPLGIDNGGVDPDRNHFSTPERFSFYSAAPISADGEARWLVADLNGTLSLLDGSRRPLARLGTADDVASIAGPCGPESYVVTAELSDGREAVRLFQVAGQRLVPIASPVFVPGKLTALWAAPGATAATAVAHDMSAGRYEAFLVTISCRR